MLKFVNNYIEPIELTVDQSTVALNLPDGQYRLTIADSATAPTKWEIVAAMVSSGEAMLARGIEGAAPREWGAGSVVYNSITAETLGLIMQMLLPYGGAAGQVLTKRSSDDYDVMWADPR